MPDGRPTAREERLGHSGWTSNLVLAAAVLPGERALVVVDEPLAEQGSQLVAALKDAGADPTLSLWAGARPLTAPPPDALAAARSADVYFFLAEKPLGDEAAARFALGDAVFRHGGRGLYLGFVDAELLEGELSQPPADVAASADQLLEEVRGAREVRVRGAAGTDLRLRVEGRPWITDARPLGAGEFGNYPGGEIFVAPHADGADGVLVADLTVPYTVPGLVDEPVVLRFAAGRVTSIEGGEAARLLRELVDRSGTGADVVAELGIGLNPAVAPRGHVMLDEKAAKTAHVAIGRNTGSYGGDNEAAIHVDCIFSSPQLEVDGRPVQLP